MAAVNSDVTGASRFQALWLRCGMASKHVDVGAIHADLCARHADPQRHYHTLNHVRHCLHELDAAVLPGREHDTVEMALWFHDAIYQPGATDNEVRSVTLFTDRAQSTFSLEFVAEVSRLIMITTHRTPPADTPQCWMSDIDLSSFGLPWGEFIRDSLHVRKEFQSQSDEQYYARHSSFLRSFIQRNRLYQTEYFFARYEAAARLNISRLLEMFAAGEKL